MADDDPLPTGPALNTPATGLLCGLVTGKKALVTGARKGIGRAVALVLAQQGADVGVCDKIDDEATHELAELVRFHGRQSSVHIGDLTDMDDVARVVDAFVAAHGTIDILVHCALDRTLEDGRDSFWRMEEETWDAILGLHLKASVFLCKRAAKAMRAHGRARGGAIVLFSSVMGFSGGSMAYGTAKGATRKLVGSIATSLAGTGIRCNAIAPGAILNNLPAPDRRREVDGDPSAEDAWTNRNGKNPEGAWGNPTGRIGYPSDIANAVLFLASGMGAFVNGETLVVDGGGIAAGRDGFPAGKL